jgi:Ca2+-binding EF-hand superfamily protein
MTENPLHVSAVQHVFDVEDGRAAAAAATAHAHDHAQAAPIIQAVFDSIDANDSGVMEFGELARWWQHNHGDPSRLQKLEAAFEIAGRVGSVDIDVFREVLIAVSVDGWYEDTDPISGGVILYRHAETGETSTRRPDVDRVEEFLVSSGIMLTNMSSPPPEHAAAAEDLGAAEHGGTVVSPAVEHGPTLVDAALKLAAAAAGGGGVVALPHAEPSNAAAASEDEAAVQRVFDAVDVNGSGTMEYDELHNWWLDRDGDATVLVKLEAAFAIAGRCSGAAAVNRDVFREVMIAVAVDGWTEHTDPISGGVIYMHAESGETSATRPDVDRVGPFLARSGIGPAHGRGDAGNGGGGGGAPSPEGEALITRLFEAVDANASGSMEYDELHNWWLGSGGDSSVLSKLEAAFAIASQMGAVDARVFREVVIAVAVDGWTEQIDPSTGQVWYVQLASGETSATRPDVNRVPGWLRQCGIASDVSLNAVPQQPQPPQPPQPPPPAHNYQDAYDDGFGNDEPPEWTDDLLPPGAPPP